MSYRRVLPETPRWVGTRSGRRPRAGAGMRASRRSTASGTWLPMNGSFIHSEISWLSGRTSCALGSSGKMPGSNQLAYTKVWTCCCPLPLTESITPWKPALQQPRVDVEPKTSSPMKIGNEVGLTCKDPGFLGGDASNRPRVDHGVGHAQGWLAQPALSARPLLADSCMCVPHGGSSPQRAVPTTSDNSCFALTVTEHRPA